MSTIDTKSYEESGLYSKEDSLKLRSSVEKYALEFAKTLCDVDSRGRILEQFLYNYITKITSDLLAHKIYVAKSNITDMENDIKIIFRQISNNVIKRIRKISTEKVYKNMEESIKNMKEIENEYAWRIWWIIRRYN